MLNETQREALLGQLPLGRLGEVEDISSVVSFLCSEQAGYITGQVIGVKRRLVYVRRRDFRYK